jgi:hypothetical protein
MRVPYVKSNYNGTLTITVYIGGVPKTISEDHMNFEEVDDLLANQDIEEIILKELVYLIDQTHAIREAIVEYDKVQIDAGEVLFDGEPVYGLLSDMMIDIVKQGQDVLPWCKFMMKLNENPAKHAVKELYEWMLKAKMPITENGNFLAYKKVLNNYSSAHTNADGSKLWNKLGTKVEMPRNKVDDDRNRTCSTGLHFCSWSYLPAYIGNNGRVLLVEINPADVVSIPTDYGFAKGRASGYWIVGEIDQKDAEHAFYRTPVLKKTDKRLVDNYSNIWNSDEEPEVQPRDSNGRFASYDA